jgi:hypothetical protein
MRRYLKRYPKRYLQTLVIGLLVWAFCLDLRAATVDQEYQKSLNQYYAGNYQKAIEGFSWILGLPMEHADLHFSLGCAYFRLGKLGHAIYHFERALQLHSGDEDALYNLETVRSIVATQIKDQLKGATKEPFWIRAVSILSQGTWAVLFLVLWWLSWGVLFLLRYISPGAARAGIVAGGSFAGLLAVFCGVLLAGQIYLSERVVQGIVLPERVEVREGPNSGTKATFKVHAGLKVRVQGSDGQWMRIRLANGLEGWVPRRQIGVL